MAALAKNGRGKQLHQRSGQIDAFEFGPYRLIPSKRLLLAGEKAIELGSRAFDILTLLLEHRGKVVSRRDILDHVWPGLTVDEGNLRVQVSDLRRALASESDGTTYITNVQGRGYVFVAPVLAVIPAQPITPSGGTAQPSGKLPTYPQRVVGRADAVEALLAQTLANRFVTVVGPGGIGKTTLAIELGHRLAAAFGDEVFYVDLGSLKAGDLVLPTIAVALGYTAHSGDLLATLPLLAAERRLALIIDCCEHVIEDVAEVAARLFRHAPQVHLITTSREILRAEGETVYFVEPLGLPDETEDVTANDVLRAPSAELLMQRAAMSGYAGGLDDANAVAVAEICRRLDGNPLAIELAASRLVTYGFKGLLDGLRGRAVLTWPGRRHDPRHRTLEATLDWSFRLLSEVERRILARLSVLIGPFTMQAAKALAVDAADDNWIVARAVEELTDKSLIAVLPVDGVHLYRIADITRYYAEMKLAESGERQEILRRHARFCADTLRKADGAPRHVIERNTGRHGLQAGNVRAALEWCFSGVGDVQLGVDLAAFASRMLLDRSMLTECLRWCEAAMAHIDMNELPSLRALRLQESLALCRMYLTANDDRVGATFARALEMAAALGERESELHLLAGHNLFLTRRGDYVGSLVAAERFAGLAQASQNPVEIAASEWMLGSTYNLIGQQPLAKQLVERGVARAEALGIGSTYYFGFDNRARGTLGRIWTSWLCGQPERARRLAERAIEETVAQNHPVSLCITYLYATIVVLWLRDLDWAERLIETLIEVTEKHPLRPYRTGGMALKGELLLARGETEAGVTMLKLVLEPLLTEQLMILHAPAMRAYAEGLARLGEVEQAVNAIAGLVAHAETVSRTYLLPELLRTQGDILLSAYPDDPERAEACYRKALAQARSDGALGWELRAAIALARLSRDGQRAADAPELLQHILARFTEDSETADLVDARELLRSLPGARSGQGARRDDHGRAASKRTKFTPR